MKYMWWLFFLPISLVALPKLQSDLADYDGKNLTLKGNVCIDTIEGRLLCPYALFQHSLGSFAHFDTLKLRDGVDITLHDGGHLCSPHADVDFASKTAIFSTSQETEKVVYEGSYLDEGNTTIFQCSARTLNAHFIEKSLERVIAQYDVCLTAKEATLRADLAIFHPLDCGYRAVFLPQAEGHCQLQNTLGDEVFAHEFFLDSAQKKAYAKDCQGTLVLKDEQNIFFSSSKLSYELAIDTVFFEEQTRIESNAYGNFDCDGLVELKRPRGDSALKAHSLKLKGKTRWVHAKAKRHIDCDGIMDVAFDTGIVHIDQGADVTQPLHIEDPLATLFARHITFYYDETANDAFEPRWIQLSGNVKLISKTENSGAKYALADIAQYNPQQNLLVLKGYDNHRVLYFDAHNNLQVSAHAVEIRHDDGGKESVTGQGNVRLAFNMEELNELTSHFESL